MTKYGCNLRSDYTLVRRVKTFETQDPMFLNSWQKSHLGASTVPSNEDFH